MNIPPRPFLEYLVEKGYIDKNAASRYEIEAIQAGVPIDEYVINEHKVEGVCAIEAKAHVLSIPWADVMSLPFAPQALNLVPDTIARKYNLIPYELSEKEGTLSVVMADPTDIQTIDFIAEKTGKRIIPYLGYGPDIENSIEIAYSEGLSPNITEALKEVEPTSQNTSSESIDQIIKQAPISKIVTTVLEYAVKGRASDIHIEALEHKTRVRYRIDGILQEKLVLPKSIHEALVSRIKILSGLKIDEKRIPQDGRFNFKIGEDEVDLRVSTLPTVHGEKVVLRLLKKTGGIPLLTDLGLRGQQLKSVEEAVHKPHGIILVTGPTGSGKSTTLYSVLSTLNRPGVNITTLEDPVEYQIGGINQVQVHPQAGLTFATGLRAFLRQDPNIILVGEIRDKETTQLALQAALTGHLVFSTLHTNDAATAIPRLIDLGGEPFLIASVLNAVVGQRICRKLCNHCKEAYPAPPEVIENIRLVLGTLFPEHRTIQLYRARGCSECANSQFYGRVGIFEVLHITPNINKMIIQQSSAKDIEKQAREEGMIIMKQDGYLKALEGITTIEEVLRVAEI